MVVDDRSGLEIKKALNAIIEKKSTEEASSLFLLAILAGVYIGFGAIAATTISAYPGLPTSVVKVMAASAFCVGLILVVIPGSELFTGNILMTAGLVDRRIPLPRVLRNWVIVYLGNFLGAVLLALAMKSTGLLGTTENPSLVGQAATKIAVAKLGLTFSQAFMRGVLCNMLVCLAVILAVAARTVQGKVLGIYFPIMVFVLCGFEHSIANMYFLPAGLLSEGKFFSEFHTIFRNLIPVTIGNIVGGFLVIVLHPKHAKKLRMQDA